MEQQRYKVAVLGGTGAQGSALALRLATDPRTGSEGARKGDPFDIVTPADGLIERYLRAQVQERFPGHAFLGEEEGGPNGALGWQWIVDPIDGTLNYSTGTVIFSFHFNDGAPWPVAADGLGFSLVPKNPTSNYAFGDYNSWRASFMRRGRVALSCDTSPDSIRR